MSDISQAAKSAAEAYLEENVGNRASTYPINPEGASNAGENVQPVPPAEIPHLDQMAAHVMHAASKSLTNQIIDPNADCKAAFARGERIQFRNKGWPDGTWIEANYPFWLQNSEYRIAP